MLTYNNFDAFDTIELFSNTQLEERYFDEKDGVFTKREEPEQYLGFIPVAFELKAENKDDAKKEGAKIFRSIKNIYKKLFNIEKAEYTITPNIYKKGYVVTMYIKMSAKLVKEIK